MKFSIKDFFSKCDQIRTKLRIWSHLLKKSLVENFIPCVMLSRLPSPIFISNNFCFQDRSSTQKNLIDKLQSNFSKPLYFRWKICGKRFRDSQIDLMRHQPIYEVMDWTAASPKIHSFVPMPPSTKSATVPIPATVSLSSSETASQGSIPSGSVDMLFMNEQRQNVYPCKNCGKIFTRKSLLIKHKLTFKQRKIYCDCGRTFRQNTLFQAHLPSCKRKRDLIQAGNTARYEPKDSQLSYVNTENHKNEIFTLAGISNLQELCTMKKNEEDDDIHTKSRPPDSSEYTDKETELSPIANIQAEEPVATVKEENSNISRGKLPLLVPSVKYLFS